MGFRDSGSIYTTLISIAKLNDIILPEYSRKSHASRISGVENIFIYGTNIKGQTLRKYMVSFYKISEICKNCGRKFWMGRPLTLEVDHIDGNHKNNLIENLRFLCPNCHSQTPSHSKRKTKPPVTEKAEYFCDCGNTITKDAKLCISCAALRSEKIIWPSLEELQKMISETNYTQTGKSLGVSDNAVRKRIRKLNKRK
jgi:Zn finger protein HypA/HybF involved in hydrogenase expression